MTDDHPSPDYIAGFLQFANGVRCIIEAGAGAPNIDEVEHWWRKNRIAVYGTDGFAEILTGAGWRVVSKTETDSGSGDMNYERDMLDYVNDINRWLTGEIPHHPCSFEESFISHEAMMGLCRSALSGSQEILPLPNEEERFNEITAFREKLKDTEAVLASDVHQTMYPITSK